MHFFIIEFNILAINYVMHAIMYLYFIIILPNTGLYIFATNAFKQALIFFIE